MTPQSSVLTWFWKGHPAASPSPPTMQIYGGSGEEECFAAKIPTEGDSIGDRRQGAVA